MYQFTFSPTVQEGSLFSMSSSTFIVCRFVDDGHSVWCEVIPHCSFGLYFSNSFTDIEHPFMCLLPCVCLFWRNICLGLLPTFWLGYLFSWYWAVWAAYIFWRLIFVSFICSYFWGLSFNLVYCFLYCAEAFKFH